MLSKIVCRRFASMLCAKAQPFRYKSLVFRERLYLEGLEALPERLSLTSSNGDGKLQVFRTAVAAEPHKAIDVVRA
ncbi:MAG: hypothetical protein H0T92_22640 [Pyrinomonadaceae bacterium]|nr:hypothetical protein [Pyrinomonadaceae bacterium]